ncbi:uncharacterized protein A4U43_C07F34920 [Asparagus officinalis]|uniref:UDP-glycosyltransferases domain-containing protein n=1 Tax=Asparagus officinalis TaxID=4686 RepID=A0A5P1EKV8_ASPOF|nr:uncharacterized protein A4U43_C07F34920 [Asparagus officinalis]
MLGISKAIAQSKSSKAHVLVLPYPSQGHINPMLQFAKRLASKGPKATLVTTHFIIKSIKAQSGPVQIKPISDGFDQVGFTDAVTLDDYLAQLEDIGSKTLSDLIEEESYSTRPFTCIVYDTYVPWGLDVARRVGLTAVAFSTQSCVVSAVYYYVNQGSVPLAISDFPSFAMDNGSYPTLSELALEQFRLGKADWVLFNSFDELEGEVIASLNKHWRARAIGPTVPLSLVDDDQSSNYGMDLIQSSDDSDRCKTWLESKPPSSVIYISFGSFDTHSYGSSARRSNTNCRKISFATANKG